MTAEYDEACPVLRETLAYVPTHMREPVEQYVLVGHPIGGFLFALFSGAGIVEVCHRADDQNEECLKEWASVIYNGLPSGAHGSPEKVRAWINGGGLCAGGTHD